ncbi:MAG: hypothetical protein ACRDTH_23045 [Pseudonocardiaceae bacterium]
MDEQRLGQAFRDAVQELPPASFGRDDVVAASRRATTRRRNMLAGGTLLGVAVLAGGLVGGLPAGDPGSPTARDAALAPGGRESDPGTLSTLDAPRCGPIDTELATRVKALLAGRGSVASGPASEVPESCPAGSRAAAVPVPGGMLYVLLIPQVEPGRAQLARPDRAGGYSVTLEDGRTLAVISLPGTPGQPAPLTGEVPDLARELAAAL